MQKKNKTEKQLSRLRNDVEMNSQDIAANDLQHVRNLIPSFENTAQMQKDSIFTSNPDSIENAVDIFNFGVAARKLSQPLPRESGADQYFNHGQRNAVTKT